MLTRDKTERTSAQKVMSDAGALFNVAFKPAAFNMDGCLITPRDDDGKPRNRFVVRTDTNRVLGLHGAGYPTTDGYRFLAEMADIMFPESTTSCTLFGEGEKVAVTQDLIAPVDIGNGDVIQPQICWISSLNGRWTTSVYDLTSRLFCQNQLVGRPLVKVKHTKNHDVLLDLRVRILEGAVARARTSATMARTLRDQAFTDVQFHELVGQLLPIDYSEMTDVKIRNLATKHTACKEAWRNERTEWGPGNRWLAYNAIQGAEQHRINGMLRGKAIADRSMEKAINGQTPLASEAMRVLITAA
jgi:hypothetical protein